MEKRVARIITGLLLVATAFLAPACAAQPAAPTEPETPEESVEPAAPDASPSFVIIHTNDTHGYGAAGEECLGYGAVAQLRDDYKAEGRQVVLVDAGDWMQGNILLDDGYGKQAVGFMNEVGYDVMAPGNHEFDYGSDVLEERAAQLECPFVCANIFVDATGELLFEPRTIVELEDGTKLGFFGLDTPETLTKSSPKNVLGLTFLQGEELYACAQEQVDALRAEGADFVICLGHMGDTAGTAPNRAIDVVENSSGIDLFINGHDHEVESQTVADKDGNEVLIVETGKYLANIGVVEYADGAFSDSLVAAGEYDGQNEAIAAEVATLQAAIDERMGTVIATNAYEMNGERSPGVRTEETNLADFFCDAVLWQAKQAAETTPEACVMNGGSVRVSVKPGDITRSIAHDICPFTNQIVVMKVTGAQLLEALEAGCQGSPEEMGGFPQVSAISYTLDTTVPYEQGEQYPSSTYYAPANPGARVTIHDVAGRGFALDEVYTIAVTDFMAYGGDTYYVFAEAAAQGAETIGYYPYQAIEYYLVEECGGVIPEAYAGPQGRIEVIS